MQEIKVLFIDDDDNVVKGIKRGLRNEDFDVLTANSAKEAIKILEENKIDIVITDEKMPGMSGSELTAFIRDKYPETLCMILSGQADLDSAIKAINEGEIYRFLTKPCSLVDLTINIKSAIEHLNMLKKIREMESIIENQKTILKKLEDKYPGITSFEKDMNGYIIIDE